MHTTDAVMRVSRNGQVSVPAGVRARWQTDRVVVVDMGEYVIVRPLPDDPVTALQGKYAGRGVDSDQMRQQSRAENRRRSGEHA